MSGELDAEFTDFVMARQQSMRRVAYLLCQDWQRADDIVQAAITQLYVHWGRARTMAHTEAYARTILLREYLQERRSGWTQRVRLGATVPDVAATTADAEAGLDMRAALAALPPRQRATLVLRFYCDLNVDQTARELGCSTGTVKSQTAKGIEALRSHFGPSAKSADQQDRSAGQDGHAVHRNGQVYGSVRLSPVVADDPARYAAREVTDNG